MALQAIAFYLMAAVTLAAGIAVVSASNPVHSVLFLIAAFFSAAGLFVLMGAEFLAMLLVVVYVGAVAVLFLFVVMMLDVDFAELRQGFARYMPHRRADRRGLAVEMVVVSDTVATRGAARLSETPMPGRGAAATSPTPRRSGGCSTRLRLLLPGGRHGAAGGDDRGHRADPAPQARRAPPGHHGPGAAHARDRHAHGRPLKPGEGIGE